MATPEHSTDTTDGEWDAATHTGRLDSPMSVETCDAVYAWYDPDAADEDGMLPKDACKLPHHEVSTDGEAGAANLTAVRNALARLESSDIPEDDYGDVRAHLYAHLDDADESDEGDDGGAFENAVVALSGTDVLAAIGRRLDGAAVAADVVTAACDAAVATVAPSVSREAPDATYAPPAPVPPAVADAPPIGTAEQALAAVTSAAASVAPTSGTAPGPATYAPPAPEPAAPPTHVPIGTAELVLASVTAHAQIPPAEPAPEPDRPDPVEHIRLAYLKELLPR